MATEYEPVIGIDLGTTYSCVGLYKEDGSVEILKDEGGRSTVPSVITFTSDYSTKVGRAAYQAAKDIGSTLIYDVKRLIGKMPTDQSVEASKGNWPFNVMADDNERVLLGIGQADQQVTYHTEELSAIVLERMKAIAEEAAGHEVQKAVVTVPAYFSKAQKQATQDAAKIAGLQILRMINEPTAASIAYRTLGDSADFEEDMKNVLVFDFGGGTLDVSVLCVSDFSVEVCATTGDTRMGGRDFDEAVVDHCEKRLVDEHGGLVLEDPASKEQLRDACEKAKFALDAADTATIQLNNVNGEDGRTVEMSLTREQFDGVIAQFEEKYLAPVTQALTDAQMDKDEIHEVVMVGGTTKTPRVREVIKEYFGDAITMNTEIDPDTVVAYGATVYAGKLSGQAERNADGVIAELQLSDVTPLTLGILELKEKDQGFLASIFKKTQYEKKMDVFIEKNSAVPIEKTKTVKVKAENCNPFTAVILEGESADANDNTVLGEISVRGLKKGDSVDVKFEIDASNILTVSVTDNKHGKREQHKIVNKQNLSPELADSLATRALDRRTRAMQEAAQ